MNSFLRLSLLASVALISSASFAAGYIAACESIRDRVLLLDATDGHVINENFIPSILEGGGSSGNNLAGNAIDSGLGTIFVSDQAGNAVVEIGYDGTFIRTVVNQLNSGIQNIRGIAVRSGKLYVCVAAGTFAGTIQSFNVDGTGQATYVTLPATASPWDITFRTNEALISDSQLDRIFRFDLTTSALTTWYQSDIVTSFQFPEQISIDPAATNGILVAGFGLPKTGAYAFEGLATGTQTNYWALPLSIGARGICRLGNGQILWSSGTLLETLDPGTGESTLLENIGGDPINRSFRYVEKLSPAQDITGTGIFDDFSGRLSQFKFKFELVNASGTTVRTWDARFGDDKLFGYPLGSGIPAGAYTLFVQGGHWLRKGTAVTITSSGTATASIQLVNGDVDGDNSISILDYSVLSDYFDRSNGDGGTPAWSVVGDNGFAPIAADLDGDDSISILDYSILSDNFDIAGE